MSKKTKAVFFDKLIAEKQKKRAAKLLSLLTWNELKYLQEQSFPELNILYLLPAGKANTNCPKGTSQSTKGVGQVFWGEFDLQHCYDIVREKQVKRIDRPSQSVNSQGNFSKNWFMKFLNENGLQFDEKADAIMKEIFVMAYKLKMQNSTIVY